MTREEAIRILDPVTTGEALAEIEYYNGFSGKTAAVQAVSDACVLAVAALREQEDRRWIPVTERMPETFVPVLAYIPSEVPLPTIHESYIADHGAWVRISTGERYKPYAVTHWMPLPEPLEDGTA